MFCPPAGRNAMAEIDANLKPGRLKKRPDFLSVRNGTQLRGPLFLIETKAREDGGKEARYGLTVSKKCGNAVKRNRIKRRLARSNPPACRHRHGGSD